MYFFRYELAIFWLVKKRCKNTFPPVLHHLSPVIFTNATIMALIFFFTASQFYVQLPLLYTVWSNTSSEIGPEVTLRPLATSCSKDYNGHSLVQTSFIEPPNRVYSVLRTVQSNRVRYRCCSEAVEQSFPVTAAFRALMQTVCSTYLLGTRRWFSCWNWGSYRFYSVLRTVQSKRVTYRFCSGGTRSSCDISTLTQTSYGINLLENSSLQFVETELMSYRFYSVLRTVQSKRVR